MKKLLDFFVFGLLVLLWLAFFVFDIYVTIKIYSLIF